MDLAELQVWLSALALLLPLLLSICVLQPRNLFGAGCRPRGTANPLAASQSEILTQAPTLVAPASRALAAPAPAPVVGPEREPTPATSERATTMATSNCRYRLSPHSLFSTAASTRSETVGVGETKSGSGCGTDIWEIRSAEDAGDLLAGCPIDCVVCCSFIKKYADGMMAQDRAMKELASAQPAGLVFATVDIQAAPEVADWAKVREPEVRLLQPDGVLLARLTPGEVRQGALHSQALNIASGLAAAAKEKLDKLAKKFPQALHDQPAILVAKDSMDKMQQNGTDSIRQAFSADSVEGDAFQSLCQNCLKASAPRVRHVASLARTIRQLPNECLVPFLDLSRRLAGLKLLGSGDPGAREALELLLDASLQRSLENEQKGGYSTECPPGHTKATPGPQVMLALQCLANCFGEPSLGEALLPVVVTVLKSDGWLSVWHQPATFEVSKNIERAREAGATLLLNASVALRSSRLRASHQALLHGAIAALRSAPGHERLNLAAGNLLAMGGAVEDAKACLQAQPLPPLRALAAAVFRGELDGPDGCAFPAVWQPESPAGAGAQSADAPQRRPGRAAIPARHRRRIGGG